MSSNVEVRTIWSYARTTPPTARPVHVDVVKRNLRLSLDDSFHDQVLLDLIDAATSLVEHDCNMALMRQRFTYYRDCFPKEPFIQLPIRPILSIVEVSVLDEDNARQVVDPSMYSLDMARQQLLLAPSQAWPSGSFAEVVIECGYGDNPDDVPRDLTQAMMLKVSRWFSNAGMDMNEIIFGNDSAYESIVGRYMRSSYP